MLLKVRNQTTDAAAGLIGELIKSIEVFLGDITLIQSYIGLSANLSSRTFSNEKIADERAIVLTFVSFCNVGDDRDGGPPHLVAQSIISAERTGFSQLVRQPTHLTPTLPP